MTARRAVANKVGSWRQKVEGETDHTLLYIGAGSDMSFPMYKKNILIDQQPGIPFYKPHCYGHILEEKNLRETIHRQLELIFKDLEFRDDSKRNRWEWHSNKRDVTIVYYHSLKFMFRPSPIYPEKKQPAFDEKTFCEQKLPAEALEADIMYARAFHPWGVEELNPNLRFYHSVDGWHPKGNPLPPEPQPHCSHVRRHAVDTWNNFATRCETHIWKKSINK